MVTYMWTCDIEYHGLVNIVHPQYFPECFQCGNKLNNVAHIIYHDRYTQQELLKATNHST